MQCIGAGMASFGYAVRTWIPVEPDREMTAGLPKRKAPDPGSEDGYSVNREYRTRKGGPGTGNCKSSTR